MSCKKECKKPPACRKGPPPNHPGGGFSMAGQPGLLLLPCPGKPDTLNNNENGNAAMAEAPMNQFKARLSAAFQQSASKINVEAEVDRLVGAARSYCEKEKFKLKQHYEEEIRKMKKTIIQEFKCAMERELIGPLKTKLCTYENEIQRLKKDLEAACSYQRSSYSSKENLLKNIEQAQLERELIDAELEKAHQEKKDLQSVIQAEMVRKSLRPSVSPSRRSSVHFSAADTRHSADARSNAERKSSVKSEGAKSAISQKSQGRNSTTSQKSRGSHQSGKAEVEFDEGEVIGETEVIDFKQDVTEQEKPLVDQEVHEDTQKLLDKIKQLTETLDHTKQFTEEEIADFIREGELLEEFRKKAGELEIENEELRRKLEELLKQLELMKPPRGSIEDENLSLRKRIQELESTRGRSSMEAELESLRKQLEELQRLKEEAERAELPTIAEEEPTEPVREPSVKRDSVQSSVKQENREPSVKRVSVLTSIKEEIREPSVQRDSVQSAAGRQSREPSVKRSSMRSSTKSATREPSPSVSVRSESLKVPFEEDEVLPSSNRSSVKSARDSLTTEHAKRLSSFHSKRDSAGSALDDQKGKCVIVHERRCSVIAEEYQTQINELTEKIRELEDQLLAMSEMEKRIKELEALVAEMDALKSKIAELTSEVEDFRRKEAEYVPPVCEIPVPDDTEARELREKVNLLESLSQQRLEDNNALEARNADLAKNLADYEDISKKANQLEARNADLAKSLADYEDVSKKANQLEAMHAQMLEEKRRKSEQCNNLAAKVASLEAEKSDLNDSLADKLRRIDELIKEIEDLRNQNSQLTADIARLKESGTSREDELILEIKTKNEQMSDLQNKISALEMEIESLKSEVSSLQQQLGDAQAIRSNLEAELAQLKGKLIEMEQKYQNDLAEQSKKCALDTAEFAKKAECIMEHGKRFMSLTGQMEQDNAALQDRIRTLEEQLEAFVVVENKTRVIHQEMEALQQRAASRNKELERLRNLPSSCQLGPIATSAANWEFPTTKSVPSLNTQRELESPWPRRDFAKEEAERKLEQEKQERSAAECRFLAGQLADLEAEKCALHAELQAKMKDISDINEHLADIQQENTRIRGEVHQVCDISTERTILESVSKSCAISELPSTMSSATALKINTFFEDGKPNMDNYKK